MLKQLSRSDRLLVLTLGGSALMHLLVLFFVHFVAPVTRSEAMQDKGLEVILVNTRHDKKPAKADLLAQADLEGGGNAEEGRSKSPLPDLQKVENGDSLRAAARRIEELEQVQKHLLDQAKAKTNFHVAEQDKRKLDQKPVNTPGAEDLETSKAIARMAAEINQTIEDQNRRPRKSFITPTTQRVGYAIYYKQLQKRIEEFGTLNFPRKDGKKMYGELIVYIPIFQDGTIYEKEGGPRIEKSSGNKDLDKAALKIVRNSAPYGHFPQNMRSRDKDDVWVVITHFRFTRDQQLETELRGGVK